MAKKYEIARIQKGALNADEAEALFAKVDETGHTDEERARRERRHRKEKGASVDVDPLAGDDPSGSNVEKVIARTAVGFVLLFLLGVVVFQVGFGVIRRANTANLSENANVRTVASALRGGVEWGNGFTQFPEQFTVLEADENTGRVEVSVTDTSSGDAVECFASSQIQSTALAINALLNPKINAVIYHVNVRVDDAGQFQKAQFFGFLMPAGQVRNFMTFVWTKTDTGWACTVTGLDDTTTALLKDKLKTLGAGLLDPKATTGDPDAALSEDATTGDAATDATTDPTEKDGEPATPATPSASTAATSR